MKIVFLDIDGVTNSMDYLHAHHALVKAKNIPFERYDQYGDVFDPRCMMHLERIVRETDAKIVVSSTWKHQGLAAMQQMWASRGLYGEVIGITPDDKNGFRGNEVQAWLTRHPEVTNYVILDDDKDFNAHQLLLHFVHTDGTYGLTFPNAQQAIKILNSTTPT